MFLLTGLLLILPPLLMARRRAEAAEMSSAHAVEASLISLIHLHRPASGSIPWHLHLIGDPLSCDVRESAAFSTRDLIDLIVQEIRDHDEPRWFVIATPTPRAASSVLGRLGEELADVPHRISFLDCGLVLTYPTVRDIVQRISKVQRGHLRLDRYPLAVIK